VPLIVARMEGEKGGVYGGFDVLKVEREEELEFVLGGFMWIFRRRFSMQTERGIMCVKEEWHILR